MDEYILFDESLARRFLAALSELGVPGTLLGDTGEGFVVAAPEDLPEQTRSRIEDAYDALMDEQRELVQDADDGSRALAAITVRLADGRERQVRLPTDIARSLYERFDPDEVRAIVVAIATAALDESGGPLCRG